MAAGLYALSVVEMIHEWTGPVIRGWIVKSAGKSSDLIFEYEPAPLPYIGLHAFTDGQFGGEVYLLVLIMLRIFMYNKWY